MIGLVSSILGFVAHSLDSSGISKASMSTGGILCCGNIGMLIMGLIVRNGNAGKACSGDFYIGDDFRPQPYLWQSGKFMLYYVNICLFLWSLCAFGMCIACCCMVCIAAS